MELINSQPSDIAKVKHPRPRSTSVSSTCLPPQTIETGDKATHQRLSSFPAYDFDTKSVRRLLPRNVDKGLLQKLTPEPSAHTSIIDNNYDDRIARRSILFQLRIGNFRVSLLSNPVVDEEDCGERRATGVRSRFIVGRGVIEVAIKLGQLGGLILLDGLLSAGKVSAVVLLNTAHALAFLGLIIWACGQWITSLWRPLRQILDSVL
jgi:hypothetical protein